MVNTLCSECHAPAPHPLNTLTNSTPAADDNATVRITDPDMDRKLDAIFRNVSAVEASRLHRYANMYVNDF